jgi:hypothetical protein
MNEMHKVLECAACAQRFTAMGGAVEPEPRHEAPADSRRGNSEAGGVESPAVRVRAARTSQDAESVPVAPAAQRKQRGPSYNTPEPWYYSFIAKYATVWMWLGIISVLLVFALWIAATGMVAERDSRFYALVPVLAIGALLAILSIVFTAALFLLAVDAARKLRSMDQKMDERI